MSGDERDFDVYPSPCTFLSFNANSTSLCIGTTRGYRMFALSSAFSGHPRITCGCANERIRIIERLFCSNVLLYVTYNSPRSLKFYHIKKMAFLRDSQNYMNNIIALRLGRTRMAIVLLNSIYVYYGISGHDRTFMDEVVEIRTVNPLSANLVALSTCDENVLLAYPDDNNRSKLIIYDVLNCREKLVILAHESSLAICAFDSTGSKIASACENGNIIKVHSTTDGTCLNECIRGLTRCATIHSLSFGCNNMYLCSSSSTETVHIFRIEAPAPEDETWLNYLCRTSEYYLPSAISQVFGQNRSFAYAKLPFLDKTTKATVTLHDGKPYLVVATHVGFIYIYSIDPINGGLCDLMHQFALKDLVIE